MMIQRILITAFTLSLSMSDSLNWVSFFKLPENISISLPKNSIDEKEFTSILNILIGKFHHKIVESGVLILNPLFNIGKIFLVEIMDHELLLTSQPYTSVSFDKLLLKKYLNRSVHNFNFHALELNTDLNTQMCTELQNKLTSIPEDVIWVKIRSGVKFSNVSEFHLHDAFSCMFHMMKDRFYSQISVIYFGHHIRKLRNVRSTMENNLRTITLAPDKSENFPVIFNIILWTLLALSLIIIWIAALCNMDPGKDSLIYRMTSQKIKKDN